MVSPNNNIQPIIPPKGDDGTIQVNSSGTVVPQKKTASTSSKGTPSAPTRKSGFSSSSNVSGAVAGTGTTSFKKILEKKNKKDNEDQGDEEDAALLQQQPGLGSIFDLSGKGSGSLTSELPGQRTSTAPTIALPLEGELPSTPTIPAQLPVTDAKAPAQLPVTDAKAPAQTPTLTVYTTEQDISELPGAPQPVIQQQVATKLVKEDDEHPDVIVQPDPGLLALMASAATTLAIAPDSSSQTSQTVAPQLAAAVDQIVSQIYTLQSSGQTDTVITLKNLPLFEGANVVITSFDTARGEFNIAFHNLTQAAQQVLSMQSSQAILRQGLEEKGYFVHIVVVTTNPIETPNLGEQANLSRQDREGYQGQQQQEQESDQEQEG